MKSNRDLETLKQVYSEVVYGTPESILVPLGGGGLQ